MAPECTTGMSLSHLLAGLDFFCFRSSVKDKMFSSKMMSLQRLGRKWISKATVAITNDTLEHSRKHLKYSLDVWQAKDLSTVDLSKYYTVICKLHFYLLLRLVEFTKHKSEMPAFLCGSFVYSYDARKKLLLALQKNLWSTYTGFLKPVSMMQMCLCAETIVSDAQVLVCWK